MQTKEVNPSFQIGTISNTGMVILNPWKRFLIKYKTESDLKWDWLMPRREDNLTTQSEAIQIIRNCVADDRANKTEKQYMIVEVLF